MLRYVIYRYIFHTTWELKTAELARDSEIRGFGSSSVP